MKLPAIEERMDFDIYLADPMDEPSVTSSLVRALLNKAPRRVWEETPRLNKNAEREERGVFDLGTAAHRFFTGTGSPISVIDAKDFRTKAAKEARDEAYANGMTPLLVDHWERVKTMAEAAFQQVQDNDDIGHLFKKPGSAAMMREPSIFWREAGVSCRCRPDFYDRGSNTMIHYKTTGIDINAATAARFAANSGWDMIAAHYESGGRALTGSTPRQFFVVQETAKPHLLMTVELDATFIATAKMRRERALQIWGRCLASNTWPGMYSRTLKLECPEWHERNMIAAKDAEHEVEAAGEDLLNLMLHWQAPEGWQPPATQGERRDERDEVAG